MQPHFVFLDDRLSQRALTESTASLANMTGHECLSLYSIVVSAILNIGLNLALTPAHGMNGSTAATAISLFLYNAIQWAWIRTRMGLRPEALGL